LDQTRSSGKGLCEGSSGTIEAPQRGVRDCWLFLCEQDSILPNAVTRYVSQQSTTLWTELFHKYSWHSRRSTSIIPIMPFTLQWYMQMGNLHPSKFWSNP
jgi:hypothetical protein